MVQAGMAPAGMAMAVGMVCLCQRLGIRHLRLVQPCAFQCRCNAVRLLLCVQRGKCGWLAAGPVVVVAGNTAKATGPPLRHLLRPVRHPVRVRASAFAGVGKRLSAGDPVRFINRRCDRAEGRRSSGGHQAMTRHAASR
jgi:hypothetical protein